MPVHSLANGLVHLEVGLGGQQARAAVAPEQFHEFAGWRDDFPRMFERTPLPDKKHAERCVERFLLGSQQFFHAEQLRQLLLSGRPIEGGLSRGRQIDLSRLAGENLVRGVARAARREFHGDLGIRVGERRFHRFTDLASRLRVEDEAPVNRLEQRALARFIQPANHRDGIVELDGEVLEDAVVADRDLVDAHDGSSLRTWFRGPN